MRAPALRCLIGAICVVCLALLASSPPVLGQSGHDGTHGNVGGGGHHQVGGVTVGIQPKASSHVQPQGHPPVGDPSPMPDPDDGDGDDDGDGGDDDDDGEPKPKPTPHHDGSGDKYHDYERPEWANIMYYITMAVYVTLAALCAMLIFRLRRREPIAFRSWWLPVISLLGGSMIVVSICLSEQTDDRLHMPCVVSVPLIHLGLWLYAMPYFVQAIRIFFQCRFNRALLKRPVPASLNYRKGERKMRMGIIFAVAIVTLIHVGMFAAEFSVLLGTPKNHYPGGFCRSGTGGLFFLITGCLYLGTLSVAALMILFYNEVYLICWEIKLCAVTWIPSGIMFFLFTLIPDTDPLDSLLPPSTWILTSVVVTLFVSGVFLILVAMFGQRRYEYLRRDGRLLGARSTPAFGGLSHRRNREMKTMRHPGRDGKHVRMSDDDGDLHSSALPTYASAHSHLGNRTATDASSVIEDRSAHADGEDYPAAESRYVDPDHPEVPALERVMASPEDLRRFYDLLVHRLEVLPLVFVNDYRFSVARATKHQNEVVLGYADMPNFTDDANETLEDVTKRLRKRYVAHNNTMGYNMRVFLPAGSPASTGPADGRNLDEWFTEISFGLEQRHAEFFDELAYELEADAAPKETGKRKLRVRCIVS